MKKTKSTFPYVNIGLSSLLVVFLVLCMTTFALLSLSSSKSDYSLSEKLAEHRTDYYSASSMAESVLAQIDQLMEQTYISTEKSEYQSALAEVLHNRTLDGISVTQGTEDGLSILTYQVPRGTRQVLSVKLRITDPSENESYYEILTWQVNTIN